MINRLTTTDGSFAESLNKLLAWEAVVDSDLQSLVSGILRDIRNNGDKALLDYTNRFDRRNLTEVNQLILSVDDLEQAAARISADQLAALKTARQRIHDYHSHQKMSCWNIQDEYGSTLGQKVTALDRVAVYVPGGKASYPSSVLMNVVPAHVAGVVDITMLVPCPDNVVNDMVLAAAYLAGVNRVVTVGGAQAIAAAAYGTETIQKVDKIVGPGNRYVAEAKRQVFGYVGLDMIAGPSEILVVCDGKTPADWIAMDLFSQAEHDEIAQAILMCPDKGYLDDVEASIARLLESMERKNIIEASLSNRGALIHVKDMDEAIDLTNLIAPEHLELSVANPDQYLDSIRHAGAIFMGRNTPEAFGDYCAGPNHVLPTSATARFSSPLGVYDFQKRTSIINCSAEGAKALSSVASVLARGESLTAHAMSAEYRAKPV